MKASLFSSTSPASSPQLCTVVAGTTSDYGGNVEDQFVNAKHLQLDLLLDLGLGSGRAGADLVSDPVVGALNALAQLRERGATGA